MWNAPPTLPELDATVAALAGEQFGSLRIVAASTSYGYDHRERPAIFVTVTLPNPDGPAWPAHDGVELVERVGERVQALADRPVYVKVKPEFPEPSGDEDVPAQAQSV